jgi:hypothetical protein
MHPCRLCPLLVAACVPLLAADPIRVPGDAPDLMAALAGSRDVEIILDDGVWGGPGFRNLEIRDRVVTLRSASGDPERCAVDLEFAGRFAALTDGGVVVVSGITFRNGTAPAAMDGGWEAGGVFELRWDAWLRAARCHFEGNQALGTRGHGGALALFGDVGTELQACAFRYNRAAIDGGAVFATGLTWVDIAGCRFEGNVAQADTGGAVATYGFVGRNATLHVSDSRFERNQAVQGGALFAWSVAGALDGVDFFRNQARDSGGGIALVGGVITLTRAVIVSNEAGAVGGGLLATGDDAIRAGEATLDTVLLTGNTAAGVGAAIAARLGTPGARVFLRNLTVHGNRQIGSDPLGEDRGAVIDAVGKYGHVTLEGSIVAEGPDAVALAPQGLIRRCLIAAVDTVTLADGSLIRVSDADPAFVAPGEWLDLPGAGGPIWLQGDYRLTATSPAIDAHFGLGPQPSTVHEDLDGHARRWDATGLGWAVIDLGAYEYASRPFGDLNCDGVVDYFDIDPFVLVVTGRVDAYGSAFPHCATTLADLNQDGGVDFFDIDRFLGLLMH